MNISASLTELDRDGFVLRQLLDMVEISIGVGFDISLILLLLFLNKDLCLDEIGS